MRSIAFTVDGKPLEVYGATIEDNKAVGHVEAQEGREFKLHFSDQRFSAPDHVVRAYVDGTRVHGQIARATAPKYSMALTASDRFVSFEGREESPTLIRPFLFTALKTTDDDDVACTDESVIKGMCSVQLKVWRITNVRDSTWGQFEGRTAILHEKSKKAVLSHQASFGAPVSVQSNRRSTYDFLDPADSPQTVIEFRYRSRAILQFEDLMPVPSLVPFPRTRRRRSSRPRPFCLSRHRRSLQPAPLLLIHRRRRLPSPSATDDAARVAKLEVELDALRRRDRMAELERELEELRNGGAVGSSGSGSSSQAGGKKRVKPEPGTDDVEILKRVKREEGERIEREKEENRKKGKKTEVIDLCDSDDE
ncbi:hypothetical protein JCM6882_005814 [Rhodosporidiobolus microsporus]